MGVCLACRSEQDYVYCSPAPRTPATVRQQILCLVSMTEQVCSKAAHMILYMQSHVTKAQSTQHQCID